MLTHTHTHKETEHRLGHTLSLSLKMTTRNIGGDSDDVHYRYRMPALVVKVEGRGNGIKTVVLNLADVAKSLHMHPAYITKFFGIELGAQSKFDASNERATINGCHSVPDLHHILDRFIQQFILCPACQLPELNMKMKSSSIKIQCDACGAASRLQSTHRIVSYMTKNPPNSFGVPKHVQKSQKKMRGDSSPDLYMYECKGEFIVSEELHASQQVTEKEEEEEDKKKKKKNAKVPFSDTHMMNCIWKCHVLTLCLFVCVCDHTCVGIVVLSFPLTRRQTNVEEDGYFFCCCCRCCYICKQR